MDPPIDQLLIRSAPAGPDVAAARALQDDMVAAIAGR
jgi:hypothetical protein